MTPTYHSEDDRTLETEKIDAAHFMPDTMSEPRGMTMDIRYTNTLSDKPAYRQITTAKQPKIRENNFLNIPFAQMSQQEAVNLFLQQAQARNKVKVYFVNANSVVIAHNHERFQATLATADLILADGSGVLWSSLALKQPLKHNLNGTDLIPSICAAASERNQEITLYLLGAQPGVAAEAAQHLMAAYPGVKVIGWHHGFYDPEQEPAILEEIRRLQPQFLLIAKGSPLQEYWIEEHFNDLPNSICMGVGGLLDFLARRVPRAPWIIRRLGAEWLWRLFIEPRRLWRRYVVGNLVFLNIVLKTVFQSKKGSEKKTTAVLSAKTNDAIASNPSSKSESNGSVENNRPK